MSEMRDSAPDGLSLWMHETLCRWLPGADVWHVEEITVPVRALLRRPALGVWYALADVSPQHTRAMISSFYGDDHLELNAIFTFHRIPRSNEHIGLCFSWLLVDLLLRAGVPVPQEALSPDTVCGDTWGNGLAALHTKPSPQREAARAVCWWWILCRK